MHRHSPTASTPVTCTPVTSTPFTSTVTAIAAIALAVAGILTIPAATASPEASAAPDQRAGSMAWASGTITWIKDHDVWVSRTDGSGARRLTTDGTARKPWSSPTGSDQGEIVAVHGPKIVRMDQWGTVLTVLDPPDLRSGGGQTLGGTPYAAVSPNGRTIAYSYAKRYCSTNNYCRVWPVTGFTSATAVTNPDRHGTSYGDTPSWVTNSRVALDTRGPFDNIYLHDVTGGPVGYYWFDDANLHTDDLDLSDFEVALGADIGVAVRGTHDQAHLAFYDLDNVGNFRTGIPTPPDTEWCQTIAIDGIGSPAFSADGESTAWHDVEGVWVAAMGAAPCQSSPVLIAAGASQPSFARASWQSTRPVHSFTMSARPAIKGTAVVGRRLTATAGRYNPAPTSVRYQWLRGSKVIKGATGRTHTVVRADRGTSLTVKVVIGRSGYRPAYALSKSVRVSR